MNSINQLFTEKYRPKNLEELILPERVMSKFNDGLVQNMLFAGSTGTGKTSFLKALSNYTGRHIVNISLPLIETNEQLIEVFQNDEI